MAPAPGAMTGVGVSRLGIEHAQGDERRAVAGCVHEDDPARSRRAAAEGRDEETRDGRADEAAGVERRRVEGDGVAEVLPTDHLGHERLTRRRLEGAADAEDEREDVHVPGRDDAGDRETAQHGGRDGHQHLHDAQHRALGEAVGQHAADGREQQRRKQLERDRDASAEPLPVSTSTSHAWAVVCIQVPVLEISEPMA